MRGRVQVLPLRRVYLAAALLMDGLHSEGVISGSQGRNVLDNICFPPALTLTLVAGSATLFGTFTDDAETQRHGFPATSCVRVCLATFTDATRYRAAYL